MHILLAMKDVYTVSYRTKPKQSWLHAYKYFLLSKDENLFLKIAPLLLLIATPEAVAAILIPFAGEVIDMGGLVITVFVAFMTASAVHKYR